MTLRLICTLIFASSLCACATVSRNKETAELHMRIGTSHLEKGNLPAALKSLITAESLDPDNPLIQNNLGLAYFVREKYEFAEKHLLTALRLKPDFTEARNNLARVWIEVGRYDDAITQLEIVLKDLTYLQPDRAWVNLGLAYFRKGQYANAKEKFAEAIRLNREHCLAHNLYGRSLLELGELPRAAASLDNAIKFCKGSNYDEPHYYSGLTYYKMGRNAEAIARLEEVIALYPHGRNAQKAQSILDLIKR